MPPAEEGATRGLLPGMRAMLWAAGTLTLLAGIQLFVFPERTERYFAWTIDSHLTAVFLGGSYWSATVFEWTAARSRVWARGRVAVPAVLVFSTLTMVVTLVHLDRFHLGDEHEAATQAVTWAWIAVYAAVPVLLGVLLLRQARAPGWDPPRGERLGRWLRRLLAAQVVVFVVTGVGLLGASTAVLDAWPWPLTALTGRVVGVWALSLGVAGGHALWEDDVDRLRPAAAAYVAFAVLQAVGLLRYADELAWGEPAGVAYLVVLASALLSGGLALSQARTAALPGAARRRRPRPTAA